MNDLFKQFEAYLIDQDRAALTISGYLSDLRLFVRWFEQTNDETFTPQAVTPTDVREYRHRMLNVEHRKASTVNRKLVALAAFMQFAIDAHLIEHDPTAMIKYVEQAPRGPRYLDKQQQFALQRAIEQDLQFSQTQYPKRWLSRRRDASFVLLLWHTGLRVSEAIGLTKRDVQLSERKGQVTVRGKGTKQRTVPLNAEARQALQAWLAVRPQTADDVLWVSTQTDQALTIRTVQHVLQRYGRAAHIDDLTPHVLRHVFGKNLIDAEVSLEKVAALLGHSNLNTTRIYLTPSEQDLAQAVEKPLAGRA